MKNFLKYFKSVVFLLIIFSLTFSMNFSSYKLTAQEESSVVVLTYHHLLKASDLNDNAAIISVENFDRQMQYLKDNGYSTITLDMLNSHFKYNTVLPKKSVLITFDDGYQSNYIYAYPILKEYGHRASIFVISSKIPDKPQEFSPNKLTYMSKEEMNKSKDVFEFACHTHNLHQLDKNNKSLLIVSSKEDISKDLKASKNIISTKYFAYPYGQYNKSSGAILKKEGFDLAFTIHKGVVDKKSNKLYLNRIIVLNNMSIDDFEKLLNQAN